MSKKQEFCRNVFDWFLLKLVDECRKIWYSLYIQKRKSSNCQREKIYTTKDKNSEILQNTKVSRHSFRAKEIYPKYKRNSLQQIFTPDKKDSFSNEAVFFFIHINFIRYYVSDIAKQIFATAIKAGNLPASTITIPWIQSNQ